MNSTSPKPFDVLIMGAGFTGLCQARHLMLKLPGLRVGLIDPKSANQDERDLKVGESTVEISAMFLYRELELQEYLIEHHCPKYGLNFHWPKKVGKTDNLEDYHHVWTNGNPDLPSYQLNRAKFEADLLRMNVEMGVEFIHGKVTDFEIGSGDDLNRATVKTREGTKKFQAHHLIDAAGRKFLIGKKLDNLIFDKEELFGLDTGSAWLRVENVDRDIFQKRRYELNGAASHYYGTNHWFGHGHWIWMIPIETESRTLSIGVVHHKGVIDGKDVRTREKFSAFLKANHRILYDLVESGDILDFKYLPRIAHRSKEMMSRDQWYVLGEAANMFDPFYSSALVVAAVNIECVTEVIRAKAQGEADAIDKLDDYNKLLLQLSDSYNQVYRDHEKHLGDAAVMSWRIYMETIFWFGVLVPKYAGKWHLERDFIAQFLKIAQKIFIGERSFFKRFYEELSRAQEKRVNIGMFDYSRADQLVFGYMPTKIWDNFLQNTKFEPRRTNVFKGIKASFFYAGIMFVKLRWKVSGFWGLFEPKTLWQIGSLSYWYTYTAIGELIHKWEMRGKPHHTKVDQMKKDFMTQYQYEPKLVPWSAGDKM